MRQTTMAKPNEVVRQWYVVDGQGLTLGRLASEVATGSAWKAQTYLYTKC